MVILFFPYTTYMKFPPTRSVCILANVYSIHMDPKLHHNPEQFIGQRFVDEEGKLIQTDTVIPFGRGGYS